MSRGLQHDAAPDDKQQNDENEQDEDLVDDVGLGHDLEALRQACLRTGATLQDNDDGITNPSSSFAFPAAATDSETDCDDDLELVRKLQSRFAIEDDVVKPLCALPPVFYDDDDDDDDFATLSAVRKRFAAYEGDSKGSKDEILRHREETPDGREGTHLMNDNEEKKEEEEKQQSEACKLLTLEYCSFPKSGQVFIDAIKRNRSFQRFIRSKMLQINARIEENEKLKERVQILRSFSSACNRNMGRALAQGKDHRIQLISARSSKVSNKNNSAMQTGPEENSHVANYRKALDMFPPSLEQRKWTSKDMENLHKGIEQQYQEMELQLKMEKFSGPEGSMGDANDLHIILSSVRDLEITPEDLRKFLPKVNWDQLASMYVTGRTGAECRARWYNFGDPLINKSKWTDEEGKKLRSIVEDKGLHNWPDIAASLGTYRTPFQCLARYQRTYNCLMLNSEWTEEEDAQLCEAVEIHGESDWQSVASRLKGRTGPQCSNRWKKSLDPSKPRKGRWTLEEDKRLKIAVQFFGTNDWNKIAQFVPGRTGPRCCERWSNCLDPSKKFDKWTEEEDLKLGAAFEKYGIQWAKIAKEFLPHRTDNACRRRCKVLYPDDVALLEEAKKNEVYPSNFVDRESERPASYKKVILPPTVGLLQGPKCVSKPRNRKTKSRSKKSLKTALVTIDENDDDTDVNTVCSTRRRTKPSSKKIIPDQHEIAEKDCNQSLVLVPVGSLDLELRKDDFVETVGGDGNAFSKSNENQYFRISEGAPDVSLGVHFDESELPGGHLNSNFLSINSEEVLHESPLPREGMLSELQLSGKTSTDVAGDGDCLALTFPASTELRTINSEGVEKASFDDSGLERKAFKPSCKRKWIAEPGGHGAGVAFVRCQQDANKKLKRKAKFSSNQALKLVDEEDVPLVFLQKKSKRRLKEFQDSERVCSPNMNSRPEFFSADQPDNGNKILSLPDEVQLCSSGLSEDVTYCEEQKQTRSITTNGEEPCLADAFKQIGRRKRIGKLNGDSEHGTSVPCNGVKKQKHRAKSSSNQVLKLPDEDVPLAVSFGNKSKKRRLDDYQNNNQVCSANMNSKGEFFWGSENGHKTLSLQEPQTCSNKISEKIPSCEEYQKHMQSMDDADAVNGRVASQDTMGEQMSVAVGSDSNANDLPLATYFRRKLKKRS